MIGGNLQSISVGIDLIEINRIAKTLERFGDRFLQRIYTESEILYCRRRTPQLAARFAAKEAVMKALGTGARGVAWKEIEVTRKSSGQPQVKLHGKAAKIAEKLNIRNIAISLSHSREYATASVIGQSHENC
tara:strand:- start:3011 stop:3406 length:396 start_codon:yes stop_codon:yes gene_type:complete